MFGVLLSLISSAFGEIADSIGKRTVSLGAASYYSVAFLNVLVAALFFLCIGFVRDNFVFSLASLPTFIPRVLLEIAQTHITILALVRAERSDFGPIRTLTIPLLLIADLALGYVLSVPQILGMTIITLSVFFLVYEERLRTKGLVFLLLSAVNAVFTISLFKYNITHFNSVEAEEGIIFAVLLVYFYIHARVRRENPLYFLLRPRFVAQALAAGSQSLVGSFAYSFAPASVIVATIRACAVMFSLASGKIYFKEKKLAQKAGPALGIVVGIIVLAIATSITTPGA